MDTSAPVFYAAGLPALISTGITLIYFLLKACRYVYANRPYPTKPKGGWQRPRQVVVNKSTAQIREKKATQKFMNKYQIMEILQDSMAQGPNDPQGPAAALQKCTKKTARRMLPFLSGCCSLNIQQSPLFHKMQKDCKVEGIEISR